MNSSIQTKLPTGMEIIECVKEGGNSTIFIARWKGLEYIVKLYSDKNQDAKIRFEREVNAYRLLKDNQVSCTPEIKYVDTKYRMIVMKRIKGCNPKSGQLRSNDFEKILTTSLQLTQKDLVVSKDVSIKNAPGNLIDIRNAIDELLILIDKEIIVSREYQCDKIKDIKKFVIRHVEDKRSELDIIIRENRKSIVFSFSDVGSHNTIKTDGDELFFLDFEHSGWDDQIKQISDWLMRPDSLNEREGRDLLKEYLKTEPNYFDLKKLIFWLPLCAVKWLLIGISYSRKTGMLNENTMNKKIESYKQTAILAVKYVKILETNLNELTNARQVSEIEMIKEAEHDKIQK